MDQSFYMMFNMMMAMLGFVMVIAVILGIIMYVFQAIGLYSISKRRTLGTSGFAWIPILRLFKLGQIADDAVLHKRGTGSHFMVLMPILAIAGEVLYCIGTFLSLIAFNVNGTDLNVIIRGEFYNLPRMMDSLQVSSGSLITGGVLIIFGLVFLIIASIMMYVCLYHIFKSCVPGYTVFFVLSLIFQVTIPFFLFASRKKDNPDFYKTPVPGSAPSEE